MMITIFTPIYNRAYIVKKLYCSLLHQTVHNFEWLVVDDGSTDNIGELMNQWIQNTDKFKIRFYQQKNGGKHRAINYGVTLAAYSPFFIVDSDDYLEEDAVETILKYWGGIADNSRFAGIAGLKKYSNGKKIGGEPCFQEFVDATNLERERYALNGDKAEVYKREVLRKFPFPEYEDERFITEVVVWDKLAIEGYTLRWINKSFMVCDYLPDGLTARGMELFINNPNGWAHYIRMQRRQETYNKLSYLKICYNFYEKECNRFTDKELKSLLSLSDIEFDTIKNQYTAFSQKLMDLCNSHVSLIICIYAYGRWGKRLKEYLNHLGITVSYVMDKQYQKIKDIKAYSPEADVPHADIVVIALKEEADNTAEIIHAKMPGSKVIMLKDIKPELW